MERPLCRCHAEPMHRDGFKGGQQVWRCSQKHCARRRRDYENKSGYAYNLTLLKLRRSKALRRMRQREAV